MELSFTAKAMKDGKDLVSVDGNGNIEDAVWACNDLARKLFGKKAMIVLVVNGSAFGRIKVNNQTFTSESLDRIYRKCSKYGAFVIEHKRAAHA